jgi:tetratricopeptide (TPR) repeat protein
MSEGTPHRVILLSMVKNESRIIERLMNSVKGKVDGILICDTGSTDNTVELVHKYLQANKIPGGVFEFPFQTFGKSRTRSFECAQEWVRQEEQVAAGWTPETSWCLLLDGDMMLGDVPVNTKELAALAENVAGVSLKQMNGSLVYSNMRVLRCSEPWICKGATHEAWTCPPNRITQLFESPILIDHGDGGCKSDKYVRDVRLLKEDLEEMPNDARTHFYLGQTYLCMHQYAEAIPYLKRRVELGGWDEEVYMAQVYLGECYCALKDRANAVMAWLDAWQRRSHRTEAAMKMITMLRLEPKSQYMTGMMLEKLFATQTGESFSTGEKVGEPANNQDVLFVNHRNMQFHFWEEQAIIAYYTNTQRPTWLRIDNLDLTGDLNWHDFNGLFGQMHWYDWCLKPRRHVRFSLPLDRLPWASEAEAAAWQPFNPSIRVKGDKSGYLLNLRYANYYTQEAKHYHYRAFHGQVLTRNCLVEIGKETGWNNPLTVHEIKVDPKFKQDEGSHIRGVEDCRLVQNSDRLEFMGTSKSYSSNGSNKIFLVWREPSETTWSLKQLALPPGVHPEECQKNWLGFRTGPNKELNYIYGFSPFTVCKEDGTPIVKLSDEAMKHRMKEYRGSCTPVEWKSEEVPEEAFLLAVHKVYIGSEGRRYYHRFMTLDKNLRPSRLSCWVRMTKERVEYWSSMCRSIEGDSYWITYGVKDSEGYIAEMKQEEIENLFLYNLKKDEALPFKERLERLREYR